MAAVIDRAERNDHIDTLTKIRGNIAKTTDIEALRGFAMGVIDGAITALRDD